MDLTSKTGHIMHLNKYISLYIETKTSTIHINYTVMQSFSKVFFFYKSESQELADSDHTVRIQWFNPLFQFYEPYNLLS